MYYPDKESQHNNLISKQLLVCIRFGISSSLNLVLNVNVDLVLGKLESVTGHKPDWAIHAQIFVPFS